MRWFEPWYNKYALMVLGAAAGLGGYEWICWSKLDASAWGTWIGSIGTVATLAGTIWLATEANRQRRREQIDMAVISAAKFSLRIVALERALQTVLNSFVNFEAMHDPRPALKYCGEIITAAGLWTSDDLAPLVRIPNHTAAKLAILQVRIEHAVVSLTKTGESKTTMPVREIAPYFEAITRQLTKVMDDLIEPREECVEFLRTNGFDA